MVTPHQPLAASINVYFDGRLWIQDIISYMADHSQKCIIDHIRMVEQVYFVVHEAIIEELYMEYTDSTNFAINFEVIE